MSGLPLALLVVATGGQGRLGDALQRPVKFAQHQADLLEGRPLLWVLGPAPLHQLSQFLQVTLQSQGGPEGGLLTPSHTLNDFCAVGGDTERG